MPAALAPLPATPSRQAIAPQVKRFGRARVVKRTGPTALFVGDLLHSPMQLLHPDYRCSFDLDPGQARSTRQRVLARAAADQALLLPAHLPGRSAATITATPAEHTAFTVDRWAEFPREVDSTT
jgi:glyoxylase-like metal-dependent hydrolase (beta-lactamase superfamily II)